MENIKNLSLSDKAIIDAYNKGYEELRMVA